MRLKAKANKNQYYLVFIHAYDEIMRNLATYVKQVILNKKTSIYENKTSYFE